MINSLSFTNDYMYMDIQKKCLTLNNVTSLVYISQMSIQDHLKVMLKTA